MLLKQAYLATMQWNCYLIAELLFLQTPTTSATFFKGVGVNRHFFFFFFPPPFSFFFFFLVSLIVYRI
ncbi:hypothetical protein F4823DRAFT_589800, partial [Ustulina deusta]